MNHRQLKKAKKSYAAKFMQKVLTEYPDFAEAKLPKIFFYKPKAYNPVDKEPVVGITTADGMSIYIFDCENQTHAELYTTLRHEMLHAILLQNGQPAKDTDTLFTLFAVMYKAAPYILPPTFEQDIRQVIIRKRFEESLEKAAELRRRIGEVWQC